MFPGSNVFTALDVKKKKTNDNCAIADEEEITFPPTYRFERDTRDKYAYTKAKATGVRSPSVEVDGTHLRLPWPACGIISSTFLLYFTYPSGQEPVEGIWKGEARPGQALTSQTICLSYSGRPIASQLFFSL